MQPGRRGWEAGVPIFVEHWGNNLQFYPNFALYSTLGDKRRPRFFSGKQIKWRPKKKVFTKNGTLFSPNSGKDQKKGFHQNWNTFFPRIQVETFAQTQTRVKLLGDAIIDHTQIIGGDISQPIPPGSGTPAERSSDPFSHLEDLTQNTSNWICFGLHLKYKGGRRG